MAQPGSQKRSSGWRGPAHEKGHARNRLLIVEPDALVRWALASYFRRWFKVRATPSCTPAERVLRKRAVTALVVADGLPQGAPETLLRLARQANPDVRTVLMVTHDMDARDIEPPTVKIEKPFELADLARLLGQPSRAAPTRH